MRGYISHETNNRFAYHSAQWFGGSEGENLMDQHRFKEVKAAFADAVRHSIEAMGVARFKQTSFFGSNEAATEHTDKAA